MNVHPTEQGNADKEDDCGNEGQEHQIKLRLFKSN